jgi:fatty acid desaturase
MDEGNPGGRTQVLLSALRVTREERSLLVVRALVTALAMYASLLLPVWEPLLLPISAAICLAGTARYIGYLHALMHAYPKSQRVPALLDLQPLVIGFPQPSFSQLRDVHDMHHRLQKAEGDPENFLTSPPVPVLVFLKCLFVFEYWLYVALRERGPSLRDAGFAMVKLAALVGLIAAFGPIAVVFGYLIPVRIGLACTFFVASYLAHRQGGRFGNYNLPIPGWILLLAQLVLGPCAANLMMLHATHHDRAWVSCGSLDVAYRALSRLAVSSVRVAG